MRRHDWPLRLAGVVAAWRFRPFAWGTADCLQFVADAYVAVTGVDERARFACYSTELGALRILRRYGGVPGLITSVLGAPKPVAAAQRADLVVGEFGHGLTAGLCLGPHCCSPGVLGLVSRETSSALYAWSV